MTTPTETLIESLRILANDIQFKDGVANAAILEAAQRMEEDQEVIFQAGESIKILRQTVKHRNDTIDKLKSDLLELKELNEHLRDKIKHTNEELERIARIAHNGGLVSLSHLDAWTIVRRITVPYWSPSEKIERSRILLTEEMSNHIKECRKAKEAKP